jgi:DNA-binding MarR family transcriptional regulator
MSLVGEKDRDILGFIMTRGEVFFKELAESNMMAKETLSNHLSKLKEMGLVKKAFSKKRALGPARRDVVYVVTPKGKRIYYDIVGHHRNLNDF